MEIDYDLLIKLRELDAEILKASLFLENIPSRKKSINDKIESSSQSVSRAREKLDQNQKKRRDLEAEVQDLKLLIAKYKRQLNEVKTNREYSSLLQEIDETQERIDTLEEEIISEMLAADDIETEIKQISLEADVERQKLTEEKKALSAEEEKIKDKQKKLVAEKDQLLPKIPADQKSLYSKIFHKKNGTALSPVRGEFCSLCHMRIRPQMLNELIAKSGLIICENCGRILYVPKKAD